MGTAAHQEPNYMKVFWALLVLTIIEVILVYLPMAKLFIAVALILTALAKAFMVAWYFMHLRSERWTLVAVTVIPLLLALDLLIGLLPDIARVPF
ncbi:MAG: hypothetical protein A2992_08065 [Elusimicrobia bacterium RIFCSPLOWO2_01_FULL_59_12]|nr:MAG: hypothetical protein A2992_08065 [Elusimicrobia bacterium RIFCSPLOWO2_01_FULL_59_12]